MATWLIASPARRRAQRFGELERLGQLVLREAGMLRLGGAGWR